MSVESFSKELKGDVVFMSSLLAAGELELTTSLIAYALPSDPAADGADDVVELADDDDDDFENIDGNPNLIIKNKKDFILNVIKELSNGILTTIVFYLHMSLKLSSFGIFSI